MVVTRTKAKFTPVDAARVALATPVVDLTPTRLRVVTRAAAMWCRELQFPTVRQLLAELDRTSLSTPLSGFGHLINVHAAVIALEWSRLRVVVADVDPCRRIDLLARRAQELVEIDQACLRLPALVWAAVVAADPSTARRAGELAALLHALAAFADGCPPPDGRAARRALLAAARGWSHEWVVPA